MIGITNDTTIKGDKGVILTAILCGLFPLLFFKIKALTVVAFFVLSLYCIIKRDKGFKVDLKTVALFSILWLSYIISLFFSTNVQVGVTLISRCVPMLLIPLGYSFLSYSARIQFNKVFRKTFIIASSIFTVLLFFYLYQLGYFSGKQDLYYCYSYITNEFWGINDHPIYLSINLAVALFFILIDGFRNKITNVFLFLVLLLGLLLLARKGVVAAFGGLSFLYFILKNKKKQSLLVIGSFGILFALSLTVTDIRSRFFELFDIHKIVDNKETSSGIRYILWNTSSDLIQESNYLGYGVGDVQTVLSHKLAQEGYKVLAEDKYNAHNQYLQIGLATGVVGIGLFLFSLLYFVKKCIQRKNSEGIIFILFFLFIFLFESVLERQNGIIMYCFMTCMFIFSSEYDKTVKHVT